MTPRPRCQPARQPSGSRSSRRSTRIWSTACGGFSQLYPDLTRPEVDSAVSERSLADLVGSPTDILLVARGGGGIIGIASLNLAQRIHGRFATIESLVVDRDWRRRGLGKLLVDKLVDLARVGGARLVSLVSGSHRPDSHRLYQAAGFSRRDNFYYSLWLDRGGESNPGRER